MRCSRSSFAPAELLAYDRYVSIRGYNNVVSWLEAAQATQRRVLTPEESTKLCTVSEQSAWNVYQACLLSDIDGQQPKVGWHHCKVESLNRNEDSNISLPRRCPFLCELQVSVDAHRPVNLKISIFSRLIIYLESLQACLPV